MGIIYQTYLLIMVGKSIIIECCQCSRFTFVNARSVISYCTGEVYHLLLDVKVDILAAVTESTWLDETVQDDEICPLGEHSVVRNDRNKEWWWCYVLLV